MRTIFLIGEDDETRRLLTGSLRGAGYRVIAAPDEQDAPDRSEEGGDLILVDLVGESADLACPAREGAELTRRRLVM